MLTGTEVGTYETYGNPAGTAIAQNILNVLKQSVADQFDGFNGLIERVLTWPMFDDDTAGTVSYDLNGKPLLHTQLPGAKWPLLSQGLFSNIIQSNYVPSELQRMSVEFIKHFRGVGRTAVVDVPEQISIEIPNFSDEDFIYFDANGIKRNISGAQTRIDLLFIYSKPVDASSTAIQKWSGGQPTKITTPILGLVKGAGVAITQGSNSNANEWIASQNISNEGHTQILANIGDQFITTNGFQGSSIHGSFPSPDDLMNLAPLISESLSENDPQLIGQSILPIAYIIVHKDADINAIGNIVITDNDIFDIRPFFRTTELTYNERAGIMAATPQPSLANPVVTQYNLDREAVRLKDYATQLFTGGLLETPRVVGGGVIWGGLTYGPEGAINDILSKNGITAGQFNSTQIPALPDWDIAEWWDFDLNSASNGGLQKGELRNDRINFYIKGAGGVLDGGVSIPAGFLGIIENESPTGSTGNLNMAWVKKRISISTENVGWMSQYLVRVQIENCVGLTSKSDNVSIAKGNSYGVWVERRENEFIIYVGWAANKISDSLVGYPQIERTNPRHTLWIAKSSTFPNPSSGTTNHQSLLAACTYPTVSFEVIGYPADWLNTSLPQYPNTPLLTLR